MSSTVEQIKDKLGIVEVVSGYVKLTKAGKNYKGISPFTSEKTPSFFVSPEKNLYYCFSSNKGGDVFDFVQEMEGVEFKEALKLLADRAGIPLDNYDPKERSDRDRARAVLEESLIFFKTKLLEDDGAYKYLTDRGMSKETIDKFNLGLAPDSWDSLYKNLKQKKFTDRELELSGLFVNGNKGLYDRFRGRIMFPFYDYSERIIGYTGRLLPELQEKTEGGKYVNTPETILFHKSQAMYGIEHAKESTRKSETCVLVEGQTDVILSSQAGVENVVAVSGTAFTHEHITIIRRLADTLIVVLDADKAGFRATSKAVKMALENELDVKVVELPPEMDPADMAKRSPDDWKKRIESASDFSEYAVKIIGSRVANKKERERMVREHLYPYVEATENSLRRDHTIQLIARLLEVSAEAIREDFSKWIYKEGIGSAKPGSEREKVKQKIFKKRETLINRILGIIVWYRESKVDIPGIEDIEKRFIDEVSEEVSGPIRKIIEGSELDEREKKFKDSLAFRAESYYNNGDNLKFISKELEALLSSLRREKIQIKIEETMKLLKEAEVSGDSNQIDYLLKELQKLNSDLNK